MENIAGRIKELREALNLTRQELASSTGISATALYTYETGERVPTLSALKSICEATQTPALWLLTGHGVQRYEDIPYLVSPVIMDIFDIFESTLRNPLSDDEKILLSHKLRTLLGVTFYELLNDSYSANRKNNKKQIENNVQNNIHGNNNVIGNGNNTVIGNNNVNVPGKINGDINIHTKTKKVNMNIQPPAGSIGANAMLTEQIESLFHELGLRREERHGKQAYSVMYSNFKKDFSIPKNKKYNVYKLWPENRAQEIIDYLQEKLGNTIKGRKEKSFKDKGNNGPQLLAESSRLHKLLGWSEAEYRGRLHYLFQVTSRADLTPDQLANYVAYLKQQVDNI